jgi:Nucleotidyl transferase AbiEii toxin, Type IV TA system
MLDACEACPTPRCAVLGSTRTCSTPASATFPSPALSYETHFGSIAGLNDGILLEVGFDQTTPNRAVTISSWVVQFADAKKLEYANNRALDISCYNPEYTFVEKVQAVVRKYGQFRLTGKVPTNFLRHYYDIHQLLDIGAVQQFIGTPEYLAHKKKRFKSLDQNVAKCGAFTIEDQNTRKQFEVEYSKTAPLYYRGQIPLDKILARIQRDLARL